MLFYTSGINSLVVVAYTSKWIRGEWHLGGDFRSGPSPALVGGRPGHWRHFLWLILRIPAKRGPDRTGWWAAQEPTLRARLG